MNDKNNQPNDDSSEQIGDRVSIFRRGRKWYANYQHNGRQHRVSLKTTNIKEARARAMKIEVELYAGEHQARVQAKTIEEGKQLYLEQLKVTGRSRKTLGKYTLVLERVAALAAKGHLTRLSQLDLLFIDRYKVTRAEAGLIAGKGPPSLHTMHDEVTIIKTFINFCLRRKLLATDPLAGLVNPDPKPREQPWWTWEQVHTILSSCDELIRGPLTILALTGLRFGELQFLTWDDIDFQHKVIRIRPKPGWKPKSGDQRAVPMSPELEVLLRSLPRISQWVVTMPLTRQQHVAGKQWTEKRLLERLKGVLKKLGLKGHLHTLRHSFISHCISQRVPEAQVRAWVGHVDPEILKHYTHIHDQQSQEEMKRVMGKPIQKPSQGGEEKKSA